METELAGVYTVIVRGNDGTDSVHQSISSLRDYFAGQAMDKMIGETVSIAPYLFANEAAKCYAYADAMIAERNKNGA
jgi:hypothetical protein